MKHATVIVEWKSSDGMTECTFHDVTINEALDRAKLFGYVEPKSYEFWKRKADVYVWDE